MFLLFYFTYYKNNSVSKHYSQCFDFKRLIFDFTKNRKKKKLWKHVLKWLCDVFREKKQTLFKKKNNVLPTYQKYVKALVGARLIWDYGFSTLDSFWHNNLQELYTSATENYDPPMNLNWSCAFFFLPGGELTTLFC